MTENNALKQFGLRIVALLKQDWFWPMAQFILVLASVIVIMDQLDSQRKMQLVTTLAVLDDRWSSDQMLRARRNFCENWLQDNGLQSPAGEYIADYFEQIGILRKLGALSDEAIWENYSWYSDNYYLMLRQDLENARKHDPTLYSEFSKLNQVMNGMDAESGAPTSISDAELRTFATREIGITTVSLALRNEEP